jgi:hypothetical protein
MGLSSSCSNMLAILISLGTLLLDFVIVSDSAAVLQYTAHVAESLGHLLDNRESFLKLLQMMTSTMLPLHGLPFFSDSGK